MLVSFGPLWRKGQEFEVDDEGRFREAKGYVMDIDGLAEGQVYERLERAGPGRLGSGHELRG